MNLGGARKDEIVVERKRIRQWFQFVYDSPVRLFLQQHCQSLFLCLW